MTYSEKLKDRRWLDFRADFIARQSAGECSQCGEDTAGNLHVHHRRYKDGAEPWEYEDEDLLILCRECHEHLHSVERMARAWLIAAAPYITYEFEQFFVELMAARNPQIALARCKNLLRELR